MCFTFKKNNKQTKKPVNCFLQDDASAGIQSLQTSIVTKLCQNPGDRLYTAPERFLSQYHTVCLKKFAIFRRTQNPFSGYIYLLDVQGIGTYRVSQKKATCLTDCNFAFSASKLLSDGSF